MQPSADDIRARVCAELGGYTGDDWLDVTCLVLQGVMNQRRRAKLYDVSTIGGRLRCARECAGMRQRELARRVGMAHWHVSKMERGLMPLAGVKVPGICMSLKITVGWLLEGVGDGPQTVYGILRKDQSPRAARATVRAQRTVDAQEEVRRRNAARKVNLTPRGTTLQSCPTTEPPQDNRASEEAAKPTVFEHP